jgi:hypothetical protein
LHLQCAVLDLSFAQEKLDYLLVHASAIDPGYHELKESCESAVEACLEKLSRLKALAYDDIAAQARSRKRKMVEAARSDVPLTMTLPDTVFEGHDLQDACVRLLNTHSFGYIAGYDASTRQYKIVLDEDDMVEYHPFHDFVLVAPEKKDRILVVIGEVCRSQTGTLIGIDGDDRIVKIGDDIRFFHASCIAKIRELSVAAQAPSRKMAAVSDVVPHEFPALLPDPVDKGEILHDVCVRLKNTNLSGYIADYSASTRLYELLLDNGMVEYHTFGDFEFVPPAKKDMVKVVSGLSYCKTGKLLGIDGDDRIIKIGDDIIIKRASCIVKIRELPAIPSFASA